MERFRPKGEVGKGVLARVKGISDGGEEKKVD